MYHIYLLYLHMYYIYPIYTSISTTYIYHIFVSSSPIISTKFTLALVSRSYLSRPHSYLGEASTTRCLTQNTRTLLAASTCSTRSCSSSYCSHTGTACTVRSTTLRLIDKLSRTYCSDDYELWYMSLWADFPSEDGTSKLWCSQRAVRLIIAIMLELIKIDLNYSTIIFEHLL